MVPSSRHQAMTPRQTPSSSMIRSRAKYSTKNSTSCFRHLLIQRVQDGVAGAVGGGAGAHRRRLAVILHVAAERALVDAAVLGAAERHAVMLELVDRRDRLAAHVFDGVLVAEPVRPLHGVVHVPAPVVLAHVAERRADAALRRDGVAAGGEHLGDAGGFQAGRADAEGGAQPGPAGADHHHVIGVVDDGIGAEGRLADRVHRASVRVGPGAVAPRRVPPAARCHPVMASFRTAMAAASASSALAAFTARITVIRIASVWM